MKKIVGIVYIFVQWTYGVLQTLLGLALLVRFRDCPRRYYRGSVVVVHDGNFGGVSLGMFVFVNGKRGEAWLRAATVHEYGHTLQSLLLGPLYLFVIGIPSAVWCDAPRFERMRSEGASYFDFYTEKWAEKWGERATGEKSLSTLERESRAAAQGADDTATDGSGAVVRGDATPSPSATERRESAEE